MGLERYFYCCSVQRYFQGYEMVERSENYCNVCVEIFFVIKVVNLFVNIVSKILV